MRVIVAGSRSIPEQECLSALDFLIVGNDLAVDEIVSGGATGPDTAGEMWAHDNGVKVTRFPADWKRHGKRAGILRNEEMAAYAAEVPGSILIAFWDGKSRGTAHMIATARKYGLIRYVRKPRPQPSAGPYR